MIRTVVSVILILAPALAFGFAGKTTEMSLSIIAGATAASFVNIDKIKRFKGGGFEAEMRHAVERAYATVEAVRSVARPLIGATLHVLTMANRWGGMVAQQKHTFREELDRIGAELGLQEDTGIRAAHEKFFCLHTWDHFHAFVTKIQQSTEIPKIVRTGLSELQDYKSIAYPTRETIEDTLGEWMYKLDTEQSALLEDYIHYVEERTLRRPEALGGE